MILGIESSCDESAVALLDPQTGEVRQRIHSQIGLHRSYGGVVPDLASREHLFRFEPLLENLPLQEVTSIFVTRGPGLAGCLAMGISVARTLAWRLGVPVRGINHLRGHLYSPFAVPLRQRPTILRDGESGWFPHLGLIVSGGNTLLCRLESSGETTVLARTVDDAVGEALDKGAKLLGLPYPGGPEIEKRAAKGNPNRFDFPRAFPGKQDLRFSFSGLKTSLRYRLEKMSDSEVAEQMEDLCASYQAAAVDPLIRKIKHVLWGADYRSIGLSGGVANNALLRERFAALGEAKGLPHWIAPSSWTGDNAAMIALAGWIDPLVEKATPPPPLQIEPALGVERC